MSMQDGNLLTLSLSYITHALLLRNLIFITSVAYATIDPYDILLKHFREMYTYTICIKLEIEGLRSVSKNYTTYLNYILTYTTHILE